MKGWTWNFACSAVSLSVEDFYSRNGIPHKNVNLGLCEVTEGNGVLS